MPMNTLRTALLALVVAAAFRAAAQPVYTFRVKVGIDRESVDSLGGRDRVVRLTEDMFRRVNRAFNYGAQLRAVYDFVVDWDAFYIYDGVSADQIRKPHPDHDYLVVMDGYKSDPRRDGRRLVRRRDPRPSTIRARTTTVSTAVREERHRRHHPRVRPCAGRPRHLCHEGRCRTRTPSTDRRFPACGAS